MACWLGASQTSNLAARGVVFQKKAPRGLALFHAARREQSTAAAANAAAGSPSRSYDAIIVGGGIAGCSAARALAARGASVMLIEQNQLTAGTTWHAAGLLGTLKGSSFLTKMSTYGRETYKAMNDESTGTSLVGWANTGSLYVARCLNSMEQLQREVQLAKGLGITQHRVVTPSEIKDINPFLDTRGIVGGVYSPEDGICNPGDVALKLAQEARSLGATLLERSEVVEIFRNGRRIEAVRLEDGTTISCDHLLLCGGAWTKKLCQMAFDENRIPVAMMPHQYTIFEKTEGVGNHLPVTRDVHHKYYLKPEVNGFMVGVFEGEPLEHLPEVVRQRNRNETEMPREAEREVYEESMEKAGRWLEAAMEHVPALNEVGVKQWLHGPDTHSPDHSPIIGRVPGSENCFVATGFNSQGIQCGPGTGVALAEFVLDGAPHSLGIDFSSADPSRFWPKLCEDLAWVETRAGEGYGKAYSVHLPLEGFESSRNRRRTPLHERHEMCGAVFGEVYGWERPLYFPFPTDRAQASSNSKSQNSQNSHKSDDPASELESVWTDGSIRSLPRQSLSWSRKSAAWFEAERRECQAARRHCALFDLSSFGKLRLRGPRALEVLQFALTADLEKPIGSVTYTLFCDVFGGALGDLTVARLGEDDFYLVTLSNQPDKVLDHLQTAASKLGFQLEVDVGADGKATAVGCEASNLTEDLAILALNGPKSRSLLEALSDSDFGDAAFPFGTSKTVKVAGIEVLALRISFAGELGWELHCSSQKAAQLYDALMSAEVFVIPAGAFALLNTLRLEKGYMHIGADVSPTETPVEAGLAFACKLSPNASDFIGKAALLEQKQRGISKRLVHFHVKKTPETSNLDFSLWGHEQELIYRNGELVGAVTSGGYSHFMACDFGMAYVSGPLRVPQDWLRTGDFEVEVFIRNADAPTGVETKRLPIEVSTKCLVDPKGSQLRGDYSTSEAKQ